MKRKVKRIMKTLARAMCIVCLVSWIQIPSFLNGTSTANMEEFGAAVTVTADDAISWVKSKMGQALDYDGAYGAQCVDLIKYYYVYLGVSPVSGNGVDYSSNALPSGWQRIQGAIPQKGDILVYTGGTGGYGHVAIFESTYSTYHQNYASSQYVVNVTNVAYNGFSTPYWGVIRPDFVTNITPSSVNLNRTTATFTSKGATATLTATVSPSNATDKSVTWKSSNTSVAKVSSSGVVTAVGNGTATITATTNSGAKTATCKVTVAIPTLGSDGWYYTSVLPSSITSTEYEIQYQNIFQKYATSSPGTGWEDTGVDKKEYTKSGSPYESNLPLTVSDTVQLNHYYYYHFCNGSNASANFAQTSTYTHYDTVGSNLVYEYATYTDGDDSRYKYYHLKWNNGSDAYCNTSNGTCDGAYGSHGNRTYYWYKMYVYQNYAVETLSQYQKTGSWGTTIDSSATMINYRYRLKPTGVTLNKTSASLTSKGATVQLTATVSPSNAANKNVTWKSSNTSVATVSSSGLVTAVGNGTATITVTTASGGKTATCKVTVSIATTGVSLNKTNETLTSKGATVQLTATVSPSNAANKNVTWKSSNTSVATVSSSGLVTAVGNGTATITVTTASGGKTATCKVTVSIATTGVSLNKTSETLTSKGATVQLTATVSPSNAANKNVTWKSSNTSVATVSSSGLVTAVGNGTATITVTTASGNKTATCKVTVSIATTGVSLDKTSVRLTGEGATVQLTATVSPSNAANKTVTWKTSDSTVAIVSNGKITAVGPGTATITATCGNKSATCKITVTQPLSGISLSETNLTMNVGTNATLTVTFNPSNTTDSKTVTWKTSNPTVATVVDGKVTAIGPGSATITATCGSKNATCKVTVTQPLTGISMSSAKLSLNVGDVETLNVIYNEENTTDSKNVTWKSSNESVATVSKGKISAKGPGTTTITATCGTNSATCIVIVKQPLEGIILSENSLTLDIGASKTLTVTYNPNNTTDSKTVTWSSSDVSVATVLDGKITAKGAGTVTITAICGNKKASCTVTVKQPLDEISLSTTSLALDVGATDTLKLVYNAGGVVENIPVTWKSSDTSIVSVSDAGVVTAVSNGTAVITVVAADGTEVATCEVTVNVEDSENINTEESNTEETNTEKIDTENSDTENLDTGNTEINDIETEHPSTENSEVDTEDVDSNVSNEADNNDALKIAIGIAVACAIGMVAMFGVVVYMLKKKK